MYYNVKVSFYGNEIQVSRYHYQIYKSDEGVILHEDNSKNNKQSFNSNKAGIKVDKQSDLLAEKFNSMRSARRSKQSIYEIVRSNEWDYFATFTFKENRYEYDICKDKLRFFLNNFKNRKCNIEYLCVPEQHDDGAWHFHALIKGDLTCFLSSTWHKNRYELIGYRLGKCELEPVRDSCRVSAYITKYITKDLGHTLKNKRRYFCSKGINKPFSMEYKIDRCCNTFDFILANFPDYYITYCRNSEFNDKKIEYIQLRKEK